MIGFGFTVLGILVFAYVVARFLIEGHSVPGFPFLASIIAIFSGAQFAVTRFDETKLANQRVAAQISGQRMAATVVLVKALGGGWETSLYGGGRFEKCTSRECAHLVKSRQCFPIRRG